jgi:hypothetical protein
MPNCRQSAGIRSNHCLSAPRTASGQTELFSYRAYVSALSPSTFGVSHRERSATSGLGLAFADVFVPR